MTRRNVFDARVHLLPPTVARLVRKSYEREAWPIRYPLSADESIEFLREMGVDRIVGICYTSMPGMAAFLNDHMAELARRYPRILVPFGAVFPGEKGCARETERVLDDLQFAGIKLHCHLLKMSPDDPLLAPLFEAVAERGKVINIHSGTVSKNAAALEEIRRFCNVERFRAAMRRTPNVKVIVPHIGYDEVQEYIDLMDEFPNLYFDTAMAFGGHRIAIGEELPDVRPLEMKRYPRGRCPHLPAAWKPALEQLVPQIVARPSRFIYGSDFPHVPYRWDFEIDQLARYLPADVLHKVLWENAATLFGGTQTTECDVPATAATGAEVL